MSKAAVHLIQKLRPFALRHARHKVAFGGRGGGKSWTVARILLLKGREASLRILCAREVQKSIKDSVHKLLADQIITLGLTAEYDVQATMIRHRFTGTEFLFAGLQDHTVESIKSYEGVDICWIEEAQSVSDVSAEILVPTIRKSGSEIWWTFNPTREDDYVYQRFVKGHDDGAIVVKVNADDNDWFSDEMRAERERLRAINDDLYRHVWEGECRSQAGLLFKRDWFKRYDRLPEALNLYIASDYAVTPDDGDYTEHGVWGMDEHGNLYAVDWWSGQTEPDAWIQAWTTLVRKHRPLYAFEEKGVILRAVTGALNRAMREAEAYTCRYPIASAGNKTERALGFAARASAGAVYVPQTEWADRLVNQLCAFDGQPGHADDKVDVCSLVGRGLDRVQNARPNTDSTNREPKFGTYAWLVRNDEKDKAHERTF